MPDLELDIGPALELLRRLSPAPRMKAWAEVVAELARRTARSCVGGLPAFQGEQRAWTSIGLLGIVWDCRARAVQSAEVGLR